MAVAVDHGHGFKPFTRPPRCRLQSSFTHLDFKMLDPNLDPSSNQSCESSNFHKSFSTPCLSAKDETTTDSKSRIEIIIGQNAPRVRAMVVEVAIAMASGVKPEPTSSGLGGAYFLRAQNGETIAVAKPIDEEPLAFNNPKGLAGRLLGQPGMKCSIRIGETGLRESAAYVLDHGGFAGVPPTALVRFSHVKFNVNPCSDTTTVYKIASLQRYVKHDSDAGDLGPSSFSVTCVHHIGILDVRLMNLDRHAGNILVRERERHSGGMSELVPIDHGFCLPEALDDPYFEWLHWPQASIPFSEAEVDYITSIDPYKDAELLRKEIPSIGESSIRVLVLCTIFLKEATAYGLCLADIGEMMTRDFNGGDENWSTLENLCINAKARLKKTALTDDRSKQEEDKQQQEDDDEDKDEDKDKDEDDDDEVEVFQFDDEEHDPTKGKPSKIPRFSSMVKFAAPPLPLDTFLDNSSGNVDDHGEDNNNTNTNTNPKAANSLLRSVSYSVPNYNRDGQCIYFGEMDDNEWRSFLENFRRLLPEAFEERKSMDLPKHRLGSSCEF